MDCIELLSFRAGLYGTFTLGADVLMDASDALFTETSARSFPELSLSPFFRRGWGSLYQGFQEGVCDRSALRKHLISFAPVSPPVNDAGGGFQGPLLGIDASSIYRGEARTSRDRTHQFVHNLPGSRVPVKAGWSFSALVVLPLEPSSWTYTLDNTRIPSEKTAADVAIEQLNAILPELNARLPEGERARLVGDRYYPSAGFLRSLSQLPIDGLFRVQGHRVLYGPAPPRTNEPGRPRLDGDRFQCKDPATHRPPDAFFSGTDEKERPFTVSAWSQLHFKACREVPLWLFEVTRPRAAGSKRHPRVSWFVTVGRPLPPADVPSTYARRFSQEHGYKFDKRSLLWNQPRLRTPEQFQLWTDLVAAVHDEIFLARPRVADLRLPWDNATRSATPQQVRRGLTRIMPELGTPARVCQPRGKAPGRAIGAAVTPAPRFPVLKKQPKTRKTQPKPRPKPLDPSPPAPSSRPWVPPPWLLEQVRRPSILV